MKSSASSVPKVLLRAVIADAPLLTLTMLFAAVAIASRAIVGQPSSIGYSVAWSWMATQSLIYAIPAFLAILIHTVLVRRDSLLSSATWQRLGTDFLAPASVLNYLVVLIALQILIQTFLAFKSAIPAIHPFSWDVRFMQMDRWLHFGHHPFALLQPILGRPLISRTTDNLYLLWLPVMWFTAIWQAWHGSRLTPVRSQFLLAFALCWIVLGTLMATIFSSAGPVFFGAVTGTTDPFAPLMDYLRAGNTGQLHALQLQEALWSAYREPEVRNIGISAMPSLHVAIAVLMVLLGFTVRRSVGWIYAAFALVIMAGSVHLGWHYAVDGYVSAAVTIVLWFFSGRVVRWWGEKTGQYGATSVPG